MKNIYISISTDPVKGENLIDKLICHAKEVEKSGADFLHCDIMDGKFVPQKTFGFLELNKIDENSIIPLDVHLMIKKPWKQIANYIKAGSNFLTLHYEAFLNKKNKIRKHLLLKSIKKVKKENVLFGLSIKPETTINQIRDYLKYLDIVLIMSVQPGKSGQSFINNSISKIEQLSKIKKQYKYMFKIAIDGGINPIISKKLILSGAEIIVSGSYFYNNSNKVEAINSLRN